MLVFGDFGVILDLFQSSGFSLVFQELLKMSIRMPEGISGGFEKNVRYKKIPGHANLKMVADHTIS